jgi:formylglycine-generating enzyme required for sulfatase activity
LIELPMTQRHPEGLFLPRSYVCYRATETIQIDGNVDKPVWQAAPWTEAFEDHQAPNAPAPWRLTRAAMLWDDEALYIAARIQEENVWGSITERDTVIYEDNDFEVFLDVDARGDHYYELEINALNTVWDMYHPKEYHRRSCLVTAYDIDQLETAVKVQGTLNDASDEDEGWTVEVKWPWRAITEHIQRDHVPPTSGQMMRVNFSRVQYPTPEGEACRLPGSRCEDWIWNSTNCGDLHVPEAWGRVYFSDQPPAEGDAAVEAQAAPSPLKPPMPKERHVDDMVWIEPCVITMGPDPSDVEASPAHEVKLDGYWIDRYSVTVAQFARFLDDTGLDEHYCEMMANPHECGILSTSEGGYRVVPGRENYPAVYISYQAAMQYAAWNDRFLPTEAQWERAARGTVGRSYPWGEEALTPERANYDYHYGGTTRVGCFPGGATPEGIYDLAGNVKEWCRDEYHSYPGGGPMLEFVNAATDELDIHQQQGLNRELFSVRGGGFSKQGANLVSAYRDADGPGRWFFSLGFRTVREEE